jgi:hypothetical protein
MYNQALKQYAKSRDTVPLESETGGAGAFVSWPRLDTPLPIQVPLFKPLPGVMRPKVTCL